MTYQPFEIGDFGGLNADMDAQQVGAVGAVDLLNVEFDYGGRVRSRRGSEQVKEFTDQGGVGGVPYVRSGGSYLRSGADSDLIVFRRDAGTGGAATMTLEAVTWDGATTTQQVVSNLSENFVSFVQFGTPSSSLMYCTNGSAIQNSYTWNGSAWASIGTTLSGCRVAIYPIDNRMAKAETLLGTSDPSRVAFSDPGAPTTFGANNYVQLTPGDGEFIYGMTAWRDMLFVFKQSRFFVFYGTSTDSTGEPIFNYRAVDTGTSAIGQPVAHETGVYFQASDGIYRTTGGPPQRVIREAEMFFLPTDRQDDRNPYWTGGTFTRGAFTETIPLVVVDDLLFITGQGAGSSFFVTLVYDINRGKLSYWTLGTWGLPLCAARQRYSNRDELVFTRSRTGSPVTASTLDRTSRSLTADNGSAFTANYRFGFIDAGTPGSEKAIREWLLEGTGTVTVKTAVNDAITLGSGSALTLGTAPAVARARDRRAVRGRNVSLDLSGSAPWLVSRVIGHIREQLPAGIGGGG